LVFEGFVTEIFRFGLRQGKTDNIGFFVNFQKLKDFMLEKLTKGAYNRTVKNKRACK